MSLQIEDVPGEAPCSTLDEKQRETAIAAATELKMLRLRNNQDSAALPQLAYD